MRQGRQQEPSGTEIKGFITYSQQVASGPRPLSPGSHGGDAEQSSGFLSQPRSPRLLQRAAENLPFFLQGDTVSPQTVCSTNTLEKRVQTKPPLSHLPAQNRREREAHLPTVTSGGEEGRHTGIRVRRFSCVCDIACFLNNGERKLKIKERD